MGRSMTQEADAKGRGETQLSLSELIAAPVNRRVMAHVVQEVHRHHKVSLRFGFALSAQDDSSKDTKAGLLAVRFISTTQTVLPPADKQFQFSDRYGHFVYFGTDGRVEYGEFDRDFAVPYHASKLVVTLLPFSNSSVRVVSFSLAIQPEE